MENQFQEIHHDLNDYIKEKLIAKFAEVYKIDYEEMKELLEDDKFKLNKKFCHLCERMPKDKDSFDKYMQHGFNNTKGSGYVYEAFKEVIRGIKDLLTCCRRISLHNIDKEINSFGWLISKAKSVKEEFEKSLNTY